MRKKLVVLLCVFAFIALCFLGPKSYAQEQEENTMSFNYVFKSGTKNSINSSLTIIEDNVKISKDLKIGEGETTLLSFEVKSNSFFNNEGNVLENDFINLKVNSSFGSNSLEIRNDLDELISSSTTDSISANLEDGTYTIHYVGIATWVQKLNLSEIDRMSKVTATIEFEVHKTIPEGSFVKSQENNFTYFTWENDNWTALLDGNPYLKNSWIEIEGLHKLELTNGTIYKEYNIYIDHFYKEVRKEEATCKKEGQIVKECSQCKETTTEIIPKLDHQYTLEVVPPTCSEGGGTLHKCELCNEEYMTDISSPLGHRYKEEWVDASCTDNGGLLHSCILCDYHYITDIIFPTGHDLISAVTKEAICEEVGERHHTCQNCDLDYTTEIPPLNHNYEITNEENTHGTTIRTYTCKTCGKTYVQNLGKQYNKVANYIVFLFDSYSPYMLWIFLSTTGIWSAGMGIAFIIAHRQEDKVKAKRMLINYFIGLAAIFVILVACPFLAKGIVSII